MIKISREAIMQYLLIYLCFLNTSSKLGKMFEEGLIVSTLLICIGCFALGKVKIKKKYFLMFFFLFAFICIQHVIIQGDISVQSVFNLGSKYFIAYCAVGYNAEKFVKRFINTAVFLAGISIIFYVLSLLHFSVLLESVLIVNHDKCWTGDISYGRFLYHYMPDYERNVGIFNEPGVYQLFLNLALFFLLYWREKYQIEKNKFLWSLIILLLALLTAASTAGYLVTFLILSGYMLFYAGKVSWKKMLIFTGSILVMVFFIQTDLFQETFVKKLQFSQEGVFEEGTGNARLASIWVDLQYIKKNIWGSGYKGEWVNTSSLASQETNSSVGLTSTIYVYGLPIAMFIYGMYAWAFYRVSRRRLEFITLLLMFVASFLSQPWVLSPVYLAILSLAFYKYESRMQINSEVVG